MPKPVLFMRSPGGTVRKVDGRKLATSLSAQGWTPTDERPTPKPRPRKPGTYYVNTTLCGW